MPEVKVNHLVKEFIVGEGKERSRFKAVDDVSFTVADGEVLTLLGPSGCGKTTTLRCVAGLEKPDSGEIIVGNNVVFSKDKNVPAESRKLGMVFQSYAIWPHMTVFENVAFPLKVQKTPKSEVKDRVEKALQLVKLEGMGPRLATKLSGGQQQRVALARALVYEPGLLLLDEPLSNLDARLREYMRFELRELLTELKLTALYVTHDQVEALALSDRIGVMKEGHLLEMGPPGEMYTSPKDTFTAEFIGLANFIDGRLVDGSNVLDTKIGKVMCTRPAWLDGSRDVVVCVRPENIMVSNENIGKMSNTFQSNVDSVAFLGDVYDCWLSVGEQKFRARFHPSYRLNAGDKVFIHIDPKACLLLPARGRARTEEEMEEGEMVTQTASKGKMD